MGDPAVSTGMTAVRPLFTLMLALTLAVTSLFMAASRGRVYAGVAVEICSGGGLVTVTLDAQGQPVGPAQLCPDLVLGFFADAGLPDTIPVYEPRKLSAHCAVESPASQPHPVPNPGARDPPLSV